MLFWPEWVPNRHLHVFSIRPPKLARFRSRWKPTGELLSIHFLSSNLQGTPRLWVGGNRQLMGWERKSQASNPGEFQQLQPEGAIEGPQNRKR